VIISTNLSETYSIKPVTGSLASPEGDTVLFEEGRKLGWRRVEAVELVP
jgi:hypothetical protein